MIDINIMFHNIRTLENNKWANYPFIGIIKPTIKMSHINRK